MISVYIASPYTKGDIAKNVKRQIDMADKLISAGFVPFAPLMTHFHHIVHPRTYEEWMAIDFYWVEKCDIVLRLDGESSGADREVQLARHKGKKVFFSYEDLMAHFDGFDIKYSEPGKYAKKIATIPHNVGHVDFNGSISTYKIDNNNPNMNFTTTNNKFSTK